jgi:copper homeostasis protein
MRDAAGGMELVLHRAFDFCTHPAKALEQVIGLGFARILSSGQSNSAFEGRFTLQEMVAIANGRIDIMPGAGIDATNIREIATTTGAKAFHFTAKRKIDSRKKNAIPGLDAAYWESDKALIRKIMDAVRRD